MNAFCCAIVTVKLKYNSCSAMCSGCIVIVWGWYNIHRWQIKNKNKKCNYLRPSPFFAIILIHPPRAFLLEVIGFTIAIWDFKQPTDWRHWEHRLLSQLLRETQHTVRINLSDQNTLTFGEREFIRIDFNCDWRFIMHFPSSLKYEYNRKGSPVWLPWFV